MSACDYKDVCGFYRSLSTKLGLAVFFVSRYCHGLFFKDCARHIVYSLGGDVPPDLYPSQNWRITSILGKAKENVEAG
jgi:hypothetical protein